MLSILHELSPAYSAPPAKRAKVRTTIKASETTPPSSSHAPKSKLDILLTQLQQRLSETDQGTLYIHVHVHVCSMSLCICTMYMYICVIITYVYMVFYALCMVEGHTIIIARPPPPLSLALPLSLSLPPSPPPLLTPFLLSPSILDSLSSYTSFPLFQ